MLPSARQSDSLGQVIQRPLERLHGGVDLPELEQGLAEVEHRHAVIGLECDQAAEALHRGGMIAE